ncbi:MAG: chain length determinant protein tyrosine kinase EpsG [Gammaproteobacteria bacterium]|nr:chain length determinant protein tyrosine kinase EpsG [Gammaproteobacteria bacterium]
MNLLSSAIDSGRIVEQASGKNSDAAIGKLLQDAGKLKLQDMDRVFKLQQDQNLRFGEAAVKLGLVTDADIQYALAFQFEYPYLPDGREGLSHELVAATEPYGKEAEALRSARSQLLLRWFQEGRKTLAIGCTREGEGASYLAANLAVLFAQLGRKTLLIDADLRQPRQHQIFNLGNSMGLSDILAGRATSTLASPIKPFPTLSVLPSGSPPPQPCRVACASGIRRAAGGS